MELNAEQIIKAMECCHTKGKDCPNCPYENDTSNCIYLEKNALALINKQETEYNELYELLQSYKADSEAYRSYSKTLEKENESLKTLLDESFEAQNSLTEEKEKLSKTFNDLLKEAETYLKQREAFQSRVKYLKKENARLVEDNHILATEFKDKVKVDTVRKMQRLIKERLDISAVGYSTEEVKNDVFDTIDQIAKEMTEGDQ